MNTLPNALHLARHFPATPEQVFDAWLVPRTLGRWAFGPALSCGALERLNLDPREGGHLSLQLRSPRGVWRLHGNYQEIQRPQRLSFVLACKESATQERIELRIAASTGGCILDLLHNSTHADTAQADLQAGWSLLLDALSALFPLVPKKCPS